MRHLISGSVIVSLFAVGVMACAVTAAQPEDRSEDRPGRRGGDRAKGGPSQEGRGSQNRGFAWMPVLAALDADSDGTISAQEIENASSQLKSLDKDGDGALSKQEIMPRGRGQGAREGGSEGRGAQDRSARGRDAVARNAGPQDAKRQRPEGGEMKQRGDRGEGRGTRQRDPEMMTKFFNRLDGDGDGMLSGEEIPERMSKRLDRVDTDQDGSVSREEMESAMSKMKQNGGGKKRGDTKSSSTPGGDRPRRPDAE